MHVCRQKTFTVKRGHIVFPELQFPKGGNGQRNFTVPRGTAQNVERGIPGHDAGNVTENKAIEMILPTN